MTAQTLEQIASCVAGYDPNALPVAQAQEFIARLVPRVTAIESIALRSSLGRVLARDIVSKIDVPSHDNSAMDGYALRGAETAGAGEYNPLAFPVQGQAMPGQPFPGTVPAGSAVRIMTGAPVPAGVDAVVPAEYATENAGRIEITRPVAPGQHVGHRGEDLELTRSELRQR